LQQKKEERLGKHGEYQILGCLNVDKQKIFTANMQKEKKTKAKGFDYTQKLLNIFSPYLTLKRQQLL
jgi:hypothetical protein